MFDIHQKVYDEDGERVGVEEYIDGLMEEFAASDEGKTVIDKQGGVGWAANMMDFGINYIGVTPADMSLRDFNEILFELFPQKMSTPPDSAAPIVEELRAFWSFVHRQYNLPSARRILDSLDGGAAEKLRRELANPANYGMAKSFVMMGQQAGFDMTSQKGIDEFMAVYNANLAAQRLGAMPDLPDDEFDDLEFDDLLSLPTPMTSEERKKKRKQRKAQRQARKRNRR